MTHPEYTKAVRAELDRFLGKKDLKDMTVKEAKKFLAHLKSLPGTNKIQRFNKGVKAAADKAFRAGMKKFALRRAQAAAARRGIAYNPVVGAMSGGLVTVAFAAFDAANTPYDENTNCLFGPRIDAAIEGMLPFNLRPEVGQLMRENEERLAREPAIALDIVSPDPPINFYQPDDGGPPYREGETGTGVITIGR